MSIAIPSALEAFQWSGQPKAAAWVAAASQEIRSAFPVAETIKNRLLNEAGVRFDDLIDTILLGGDDQRISQAIAAGWVRGQDDGEWEMYSNPHGMFPQIAVDRRLPAGRVTI